MSFLLYIGDYQDLLKKHTKLIKILYNTSLNIKIYSLEPAPEL